jgi:hypothetical protein
MPKANKNVGTPRICVNMNKIINGTVSKVTFDKLIKNKCIDGRMQVWDNILGCSLSFGEIN